MKGKRIIRALLLLVFVLNISLCFEAKAEAEGTASYDEEPFAVKSMLYDSYSDPAYSTYKFDPGYWRIIPVTAEHTGWLYFDMKIYGNQSDELYLYVVDSYAETEDGIKINYRKNDAGNNVGWILKGGNSYTGVSCRVPVTKGEKFWIYVRPKDGNEDLVTMDIRARVFTTSTRTVKQGAENWATVSGINKSGDVNTTWFKVKPTKTGVMSFKLKEFGESYSDGNVRLYNADKKALSNTILYHSEEKGYQAYFGVKKNTTYYVKVTNCGGTDSSYYKYGVKFSVTERTDRALGSRDKAKTLKRKADATNTLFVASTKKSTDWYKFKVDEKRETVIQVDASAIKSGSLYVYFYRGDRLLGETKVNANSSVKCTVGFSSTKGKADPGTYHVKVVKGTRASGKYSIKYVK